jgi:hypothetical protein
LSYIRTPGVGKDQNFVWLTKAFLFDSLFPSFEPFLNFFYSGYLAGNLDHSIDHQSRGDHDPVAADLFNILNLHHFSFDFQISDCLFGPLRELVAFGSTHSQDFDFLHRVSLPLKIFKTPPSEGKRSSLRHLWVSEKSSLSLELWNLSERPEKPVIFAHPAF